MLFSVSGKNRTVRIPSFGSPQAGRRKKTISKNYFLSYSIVKTLFLAYNKYITGRHHTTKQQEKGDRNEKKQKPPGHVCGSVCDRYFYHSCYQQDCGSFRDSEGYAGHRQKEL